MAAPLGETALSYADDYGYEVFPLVPTGKFAKVPATSNGMLDASNDLTRVRAWWEEKPDALIGHRVPPEELILDVDPRHGGMGTYKALKAELGLAPARVHISGRGDGGGHLHFQRPPGRLSTKGLALWAKERGLGEDLGGGHWSAGIDLLHHDHRYTILPPSPHPVTGQPYFWRGRGPEDPPGGLPEAVIELLTAEQRAERHPPGPHDPTSIADWFSATYGFSWLSDVRWELVKGDGTSDDSGWRHPTATSAVSATVRHRCLFVYSENTPFEVTMPSDPAGYTPFRAWAVLCHGGDLSQAAREARKLKTQAEQTAALNGLGPVRLGDVRPRHVRWLWHPFLPLGKMVIHAGEPGLMKSSFDVAVAAMVTHGKGFAEAYGPQNVVFLNFEDDDEDGLVPRLMAADADLSRCFSVPDLPDGVKVAEVLANIVKAVRPICVFVDPFGSWAEAAENTGLETQVRQSLRPLRELAKQSGALVKVNCHPNKQNSLSDALYRISGSLGGMVGYARVVLASKREEDQFVAGIVKSNVGLSEVGVEYFPRYVPVELADGVAEYPRVMFGDQVAIERAKFFEVKEDKGQTKAAAAAEAIQEFLKDGPRLTKEVKAALADRFGRNAIQDGAVIAEVETLGQGRGARWALPGSQKKGDALSTQSVIVDLTESSHSAAPQVCDTGGSEFEDGIV